MFAMQRMRISMLRAGLLAEDKPDCASFALDNLCSHALTDLDDMESCSDDTEELSMPAESGAGGHSPVGGKLLLCTAALGYIALLQLLSVLFVCFSHGFAWLLVNHMLGAYSSLCLPRGAE